jgi:glucokinase
MRYALGIDLGGTKILAGVIDLDRGKVVSVAKRKSQADQGPDELTARLLEAASEAIDGAKGVKPEAIGVGAPGQIDQEKGILLSGPNLGQRMDNLPLRALLHKRFGLPVLLANDVEIGATGEGVFGAGKGYKDFMCVFVGTGIGGAIIRDGQPYRGATNTAGEVGHIVVDVGGRLCGCGGQGHLEAYASRSSIVRAILGELRAGRQSVLSGAVAMGGAAAPGGTAIRSKTIARAVAEGDRVAVEAIEDASRYLSAGLASVVNFYNPPRIILGGGLIEAVDLYFDGVARRVEDQSLQATRGGTAIVRTGLGDNAGIVGAAVLAAAR